MMQAVPQVDDLLQGMSEWRNIQEVIRSTFKALHEVIKSQGDAVKSLERQVDSKACIADIQSALQRKANVADVNHSLRDVSLVLEGKAALYDLDTKADKSEIESSLKLKASVSDLVAKADRSEFEEYRITSERQIQALASQIESLQQVHPCPALPSIAHRARYISSAAPAIRCAPIPPRTVTVRGRPRAL